MTGVVVLVLAVLLAGGFGLWRRRTDGRFRTPAVAAEEPARGSGVLTDTPWADQLGERATLLQFSSAFCAPCRVARVVLADVAATVPGVRHLEVDAEQHLDLVRRLDVLRTPTTLMLDARGAEITRASGAPTRQVVLDTLERALA